MAEMVRQLIVRSPGQESHQQHTADLDGLARTWKAAAADTFRTAIAELRYIDIRRHVAHPCGRCRANLHPSAITSNEDTSALNDAYKLVPTRIIAEPPLVRLRIESLIRQCCLWIGQHVLPHIGLGSGQSVLHAYPRS